MTSQVPIDELVTRRQAAKWLHVSIATLTFGNWPGVMLNAAMRQSDADIPFVLLGGHLQGVVGDFNGNYALSADLAH